MDLTLAFQAIVMGIVEGLTEFLPISSTGHLILAGSLLNFTGDKVKVFEIVIQTGAMLAIVWEYRARCAAVASGLFSDRNAQRFLINVVIAFLPLAILGVLFSRAIKDELFNAVTVATMFIVGGLIILWVERALKLGELKVRVDSIDDMSALDALKVGCAQAFALIPGTSRSGASIIGGMWFGLSRKASTEFSFFLAIPTILGASVYSLVKERHLLSVADLPWFSLGSVAAFISAFICVRWLMRYISTHDFSGFGWYRIVFGIVIIFTDYTGLVAWVD